MGVVLPDELAWVLDLIGINWPNVDEDEYREMADELRDLATSLASDGRQIESAAQEFLGITEGAGAEAFQAHWDKVIGTHMPQVGQAIELFATGLDGAALVITGAKIAAVVQLGILAAEVIAAQAAAPFTFGLSEAGALGATQATRVIVRRLLKEAEQQLLSELLSLVEGPVFAALGSIAQDLVVQLARNALGAQQGINWGEAANAGKSGFKDGVQQSVDQVKGYADDPLGAAKQFGENTLMGAAQNAGRPDRAPSHTPSTHRSGR
ncbi:WXG100-like domain-containing protein [Kitasatospora cineracea]|uniref:WXG100-like domain-containing protein n=1 Tax=Kitasatospora cineracea TaxID=88074 RepID=UPI00340AAB31